MNISKQTVIFSVERTELSKEKNEVNTATIKRYLKENDYNFAICNGVYKGTSEVSFVVVLNDYSQVGNILELSKLYNQESILYIDSNRMSYLYFQDSTCMKLGKFRQVSKDIATSKEAYTELNNTYYIAS